MHHKYLSHNNKDEVQSNSTTELPCYIPQEEKRRQVRCPSEGALFSASEPESLRGSLCLLHQRYRPSAVLPNVTRKLNLRNSCFLLVQDILSPRPQSKNKKITIYLHIGPNYNLSSVVWDLNLVFHSIADVLSIECLGEYSELIGRRRKFLEDFYI